MPIQNCKVSFQDRHGVIHSVDVQASTVYEAVCRASAIFKNSVVEDPTWTAKFLVEVLAQKSYRVKPGTMRRWLARSGTNPKEHIQRKRLKQMLEGN